MAVDFVKNIIHADFLIKHCIENSQNKNIAKICCRQLMKMVYQDMEITCDFVKENWKYILDRN